MRILLALTGVLLLASAVTGYASSYESVADRVAPEERDALLDYDLQGMGFRAFQDTVWLGGSGSGDGSVVRGGIWDFEADSGETPEFFMDGDPVGNEYRDGFRFMDFTSVGTLSQHTGGHWFYDAGSDDQVYDFDDDSGAFAHRASVHANDGIDDGPDPLAEPGVGGSWSIWIGTNLYVNPEICGYHNTAGYGDGWSQGIMKHYTITAGGGTPLAISFYHRYASEAGFDTCWVETSYDGVFWEQVGTAENPNGIFEGGDKNGPLPAAGGSEELVQLGSWFGGTGDFWVRFRLSTDGLNSDETRGGEFFYGWQLDNISMMVGSAPQDDADFEDGLGGWEPSRFAGFDFDLTLDPMRPAGRIVSMSDLLCPINVPCPEACGLEGNLLIFCDKDDCNLHDEFMSSYAVSPAISIGGPENPDIDGAAGRLFQVDVYWDGGSDLFETGMYFDFMYWPYNTNHCPYTPASGAPGQGESFNWSRLINDEYVHFGAGATCATEYIYDISDGVPAEADSVILCIGAISQCRSESTCDLQDAGTPFFDNIRFGVYDPEGISIVNDSFNQYCDSFPMAEQAHQGMSALSARSDGSHSYPSNLGLEIPPRYVRADTALVESQAPNAAAYLHFKVEPGPCQSLANPFWVAYPPNAWHEARMDVGREQGTGIPRAGTFMTCFHASDPHDGTSWGGEMIPVEPCDDILPDGVFSAGTRVSYFFELRNTQTGNLIGTAPSGRSYAPIDTTLDYASMWRRFEVLPELVAPAQGGNCDPLDPLDRVNSVLLVNDCEGSDDGPGVHRGRMVAYLDAFDIDYDVYDVVGTRWGGSYNGIGRREDRPTQQPRPPMNGATQAQLEPYDVIWYVSDWLDGGTLSDQTTLSIFGGQPTCDQQKLEGWLAGCTAGENRLLILDGYGWASDIDNNTTHGETFLTNLGVDVLDSDYEALSTDLRRCARITGNGAASDLDGEIWGTGCPNDIPSDVFASVAGGQTVANFVYSLENGTDPVNCADDQNMPSWAAVVRQTAGSGDCERTVAMSFSFIRLHPLNCVDECQYNEWSLSKGTSDPNQTIAASPAQFIADMFGWGGHAIGAPIGVDDPPGSPALRTQLIGARPNPANPSATISFTLAHKGDVTLKIFDVGGRLVRTLVDGELEATSAATEVIWDGLNDAGQRVGSGVFFYQLEAPGYTSAKKLVILK
ncbi:MAG: hypothetical protein PVF43_09425 [Candidatus Eiseniibacteriota bacterium]